MKLGIWHGRIAHYCPACEELHFFVQNPDKNSHGAGWNFKMENGQPTFTPSMKIGYHRPWMVGEDGPQEGTERVLCHYNLTDGKLIFHEDCPHIMKGKTVDLPEIPIRYMAQVKPL